MKPFWPICMCLLAAAVLGPASAAQHNVSRTVPRATRVQHSAGGSCGPDGRVARGTAGEMLCVDNVWQYRSAPSLAETSNDAVILYSLLVQRHGKKVFEVRAAPTVPGIDGSMVVCVSSRGKDGKAATSVYTVALTQAGDDVEVTLDSFRQTVRAFEHGAVSLADGDKTLVLKVVATISARSSQELGVASAAIGASGVRIGSYQGARLRS